MELAKEHPYSCNWLWILIRRHKHVITAEQCFDYVFTHEGWLSDCVRRDGKNNYAWSQSHLITGIHSSTGHSVNFSNILRFKYEEDLLAFRLRFDMYELQL